MRRLIKLIAATVTTAMLLASSTLVNAGAPDDYVRKYSRLAQDIGRETGVPASLILAVAIVESGYGKSKSSKLLNNHFGIVGGSETGATKPYSSRYRYFANHESSFRAFASLMVRKYNVPELKKQGFTVSQIIKKIKCRYDVHTPESWEQQLNKAIRAHRLTQFDA
jgi:flagellum-specific peptidoglycan hydrolase FlgJ